MSGDPKLYGKQSCMGLKMERTQINVSIHTLRLVKVYVSTFQLPTFTPLHLTRFPQVKGAERPDLAVSKT